MSVGIDIGSKTIKIAELAGDGGKFSLKAAGIVGYSGNTVEHMTDDKEFADLSAIIKKLFQDSKVSSKDVILALPESQVFTRVVKLPLLTDQEVASAIKWEAEQYIPIPIADAIIQHEILERKEGATPPSVSVLLVAAPRVMVEKYVRVLTMAGLNPVAVETELVALTRSLAPANQSVLIVDFGARSTDIAIAKGGQLMFSRSIPTAGEAFTRAVAQGLGVASKQAEEYKRTYGLSGSQLEGKVGAVLDPVFRVVAEEIKKAIHFYQTEEKGDSPASLVLSGGTAGLPEVSVKLAKLVGLEVVIGNPFAKVTVDPASLQSLAPYAPVYSIAVGLALRGD